MIKNVNEVTAEMVGTKFIEWVEADRAYQNARENLYHDDFADIDPDDEYRNPTEFKAGNQPYREHESTADAVKAMHDALKHQNKIYDELMELTDLYLAKIRGGG